MTDFTSHPTDHSTSPNEPDPDFIRWFKDNSVPIASVILGALLLCLIGCYSSISVDWTRTKDVTETLSNVIQSLALVGGGVWAYFKFAKGRTFRDRLTPKVSGRFVSIDGSVFLVATAQIQNVGLSNIAFSPQASALIVFEYVSTEAEQIVSVRTKRLTSFGVFGETDRSIEPNEILTRQSLIALPGASNIGYQLEFEVVSESGYRWRATTIVDKSDFEDNEVGLAIRIGDKKNSEI